MTDLVRKSARELRVLIGRGKLSPVELVDACLERIDQLDPVLNAVVALDRDGAREAAKRAEGAVVRGEALGPLHGLPVLIKDLVQTRGLVTTRGSLVYRDHVPEADDLVAARIRAAGAIILGKTNTPEFGAGSNTVNRVYGATVNPFDPTLSAAGSSGGAAVALACDMAPLATGSDMGGSVRTPSSFCGVVGHRPSSGLVPRPTRKSGWSTLSVDGPMARDVTDACLLLAAMSGGDLRDPLSREADRAGFLALPTTDPATLRVAFTEDIGCAPVAGDVRAAFRDKVERIAPLFARGEWTHPDMGPVHETFETLRGVDFIEAYGNHVEQHRARSCWPVVTNVESARAITVDAVARALVEQTTLYHRMQDFFADFDLLICPSASVVPFPVENVAVTEIDGEAMATYITWIAITYALTLTTHPVTVIPCGLGPTGLPFGLQLAGPARGDLKTLAAAAAIEAALAGEPNLSRPRPDIPALLAGRNRSKAGLVPEGLAAG